MGDAVAEISCDVAVIGAGTAGLAAFRAARAAGAHAVIIESGPGGTTCARVGCMPAKLLIAAADAAHGARSATTFGVGVASVSIDGRAVMRRVQAERDRFVDIVRADYAELPQEMRLEGRARFLAPTTLAVDGTIVSARAIVIATGSTPLVPDPYRDFADLVDTTDTVFDMTDLPSSLAVVGAGPLGLELAQALARLDVRCAVFDRSETIGGLSDRVALAAAERLIGRDLPFHLGVTPEFSRAGEGVRLRWTEDGAARDETFARVLVATGRPPNVTGLDLEAAGLACDQRGTPLFDPETMRCGASAIFIAGDADAARPVLHEASLQGEIAGRNAALWPQVERHRRPPAFAIVFTSPNLATVGLRGADVDPARHVVGVASYDDQGRARIAGACGGPLRLFADRETGQLLGAEMVGPRIEHVAHLVMFAVDRGLTASAMLAIPVYHPTFEEGLHTALRSVCAALHEAGVDEPLHAQDSR